MSKNNSAASTVQKSSVILNSAQAEVVNAAIRQLHSVMRPLDESLPDNFADLTLSDMNKVLQRTHAALVKTEESIFAARTSVYQDAAKTLIAAGIQKAERHAALYEATDKDDRDLMVEPTGKTRIPLELFVAAFQEHDDTLTVEGVRKMLFDMIGKCLVKRENRWTVQFPVPGLESYVKVEKTEE